MYNKVTQADIAALQQIVGESEVFVGMPSTKTMPTMNWAVFPGCRRCL